jgi:hypothetical protein
MSQTKKHSFLESLTNVGVGYGVALASQVLIFPLYGIHIPLSDNIAIGIWFTVISIIRSYVLRRWFNKVTRTQQIKTPVNPVNPV